MPIDIIDCSGIGCLPKTHWKKGTEFIQRLLHDTDVHKTPNCYTILNKVKLLYDI